MDTASIVKNNTEVKRLTSDLDIVWSHQSGFKEVAYTRVFNHRRPSRLPVAVVRVTSEEDIVAAVKLANVLNVRVSVKSGGHSWAAWGVRENAILIDMGNLSVLNYNDEDMTVTASTSITGRTLNGFLVAEKGRFFPGGHCPDVGIGGFLLQGGMGWCCRGWGWACQQIESLKAVLHDGSVVNCSRTENPDLFWVARGCGPGFPGVVVTFTLRTRAVLKAYGATYVYPISKFREVSDWVTKVSPTTDKDVETVYVTKMADDTDDLIMIVHAVAFKETEEECMEQLSKFHVVRPTGALFEVYGEETSLAKEYHDQGNANPERHRYRADNVYLKKDVDVGKVLEPCFTTIPNRNTFCLYFSMDPLTELEDMSLSMQTEHYVAVYSVTDNEKEDDWIATWLARHFTVLEKHSEGAYLGDSDFQSRITPFWSRPAHQKLNRLRKHFDPFRRFCGYLKNPVDESKNNEIEIKETIHQFAHL